METRVWGCHLSYLSLIRGRGMRRENEAGGYVACREGTVNWAFYSFRKRFLNLTSHYGVRLWCISIKGGIGTEYLPWLGLKKLVQAQCSTPPKLVHKMYYWVRIIKRSVYLQLPSAPERNRWLGLRLTYSGMVKICWESNKEWKGANHPSRATRTIDSLTQVTW